MMRRLSDPSLAAGLFEGCTETMVWSCLQGVMGEILVKDGPDSAAACGGMPAGKTGAAPRSACAHLGAFYFFGGQPDGELLSGWLEDYHAKREGAYVIAVPIGPAWEKLMERELPGAEKSVRYAIRKDPVFNREHLKELMALRPDGVELKSMDRTLYEQCRKEEWSEDLTGCFDSAEEFLKRAAGVLAVKDGEILAGCCAYSAYNGGIEVEVDTRKDQRRKHLALSCSAALILECLDRGLYPSWDAMNPESVGLSEKLGYRFDHEYPVFTYG